MTSIEKRDKNEYKVRIPTSPYENVWNVESLKAESERLSALPDPFANVRDVTRWRRKQLWLIALRIRELNKSSNHSMRENTHV